MKHASKPSRLPSQGAPVGSGQPDPARTPATSGSRTRQSGFTLIEALIALAVVAILASLAWPSFAGVLQRSRRIEATSALMQVQLAQERWRSAHASYAVDLPALGFDTRLAAHYRLAITASGAHGYRVVATAIGMQAADTACRTLVLTLDAGRSVLGSSGSAPANVCWRS